MTTPYLDVAGFKARTLIPASYVDEIEDAEIGWTLGQLTVWTSWLNSQLRKRYAAPFSSPYPETVIVWLEAVMTERVLLKRGVDPTDKQASRISELADKARDEIQQAANAESGLFDLPLRSDTTADGISKGAPLLFSQAGPYAWTTNQREDAEDDLEP